MCRDSKCCRADHECGRRSQVVGTEHDQPRATAPRRQENVDGFVGQNGEDVKRTEVATYLLLDRFSIVSADSRCAATAAASRAAAGSVSGRPVAWRPLTISRGAPNFSATAAAQRAAPLDAVVPSTPTTTDPVTVDISSLTGTGRR